MPVSVSVSAAAAVFVAAGPAKTAPLDNRFHLGDCLSVLAELCAAHGAFADLVYLDPPFNSARLYNHALNGGTVSERAAFHDTWKWTEAAKKDFRDFRDNAGWSARAAEFLKAMRDLLEKRDPSTLAYLTYMTPRLTLIRKAMKPTASVYLHCDPTASHYLKLAMDAVFGRENFRNHLVWHYENASRGRHQWAKSHDDLLWYALDGRGVFNREKVLAAYKSGMTEWRYKKKGKPPPAGKTPDDVLNIPALNTMDKKERLGYNTQKPLALLKRVVEASSNPGDLVLDPFCGCGTTIAACHELGRRFVGIDVSRVAADVIGERMRTQYPDFGELQWDPDKKPDTVRGWKKLLREDDEGGLIPVWARFQYAAIAAIPKAFQRDDPRTRRGPDGGVDGWIPLKHPKTGAPASVVIQVKRKKHPSVADVADTIAAVDNNGAFMGLLITLNPPSAEMKKRGESKMRRFNGAHYPKVAILTYAEVKAGKYAEVLPYHLAVDIQVGGQAGLDLKDS